MAETILPPNMMLVWRVSPDPNGAFDYLVVGSAEAAGTEAARAAEMSWDAGDDPPQEFAISCAVMDREEFRNLPEP